METRLFFFAFLLLACPFLQLVRCELDSEVEVSEAGGDLGIVGDDVQDFSDKRFSSAPGVDTVCVFPQNAAKVVPAGEQTELLVGVNNAGDSSLNVIAIKASVHLPFDHSLLVQNLTVQEFYNASVLSSAQATFPYIFAVNKYLQLLFLVFLGYGCMVKYKTFPRASRSKITMYTFCKRMGSKVELGDLLNAIPPVEFCCAYGSALLPKNTNKETMVDYILGVSDPMQWHSENLKMNKDHYVSLIARYGGAKLITEVADQIGVGVHFNPFVKWNDKMIKYGVVRMHDLVQDILNWDRLYLSGRLQKPVHMIVDNLDLENVNSVNLRAAMSAALLLLPTDFTEEELYAKICSLSYMGDLRMLFAEDKNKVKTIVQGQLDLFRTMYKPFLEEYGTKELLKFPVSGDSVGNIMQAHSLSATRSLVSSLPSAIRSHMGMKLGEKQVLSKSGRVINEVAIGSHEEAAECMRRTLRRTVMVSSARQAVSGLLTTGGINAARYLTKKMIKAWKSWR